MLKDSDIVKDETLAVYKGWNEISSELAFNKIQCIMESNSFISFNAIEINDSLLVDTGVPGSPTFPVLTLTDYQDLDLFEVGDVVQGNAKWNQSQ